MAVDPRQSRRWLYEQGRPARGAIVRTASLGWLAGLGAADDPEFRARFAAIKADNKRRFAEVIQRRVGVEVDPASLFDVQVKRIHEYKRQLLNLLYVVTR